ncbi:MAG: winged helix-turn-helix domain-containing protein [Anaplasmataceae bacterium]|nr:winged helix-turn-helix domain-containing protein [Anaplasmataceae bacterium]
MIQSVPNALSPCYMGSFEMEIAHAKFLNYLNKRKKVKRSIIHFDVKGITYSMRRINPLIEDLKKENAIIDDGKLVTITDQGEKLLQNNQHLLQRAKYKKYKNAKVRCDKAIPTEEDFRILELLKAKTIDNSFTVKAFAEELGLTRTLVTYRMQRLKNAKLIDYEPRRPYTIKILEKHNN